MSARTELLAAIPDHETLLAIAFGDWGWGGDRVDDWDLEVKSETIPRSLRNTPLKPEVALPLMDNWKISGGYGSPECYALYAWTDKTIYFISQYDGSTCLEAIPRHPLPCVPTMPGG